MWVNSVKSSLNEAFRICLIIASDHVQSGKLAACTGLRCSDLFVLLQLGVVDLADLGEFGSVIWVFGWVIGSDSSRCRRRRRRCRPAPFLRPGHALRQQHVVQSHQLGIGRLLLLNATDTQHWNETSRRGYSNSSVSQDAPRVRPHRSTENPLFLINCHWGWNKKRARLQLTLPSFIMI